MKFNGHTMATPQNTTLEAVKLFSKIGMDGMEIVVQDNSPFCIDESNAEIEKIIEQAKALKYGVVTLTPYYWGINDKDETSRRANIDGMKKAVLLAKRMGASYVRAYGGKEEAGGTFEENWNNSVEALKEIGEFAVQNGICIIVENHPGTMTRTGEATANLVKEVNCSNVRVLYDPANVMYDTDEDWEYTFEVQKDFIEYVHMKDYYIDSEGNRKACLVGKGIVPWDKIIKKLDGYDGFVSFEYEKKWYPDQLEDADTGLPKCVDYVRGVK